MCCIDRLNPPPYADLSGEGSAIAARMAVEEFDGRVKGVPVEVVTADHQNKTDVGAAIARKWYDADGVDLIVDVAHSAISLAIGAIVKDTKGVVIHTSASTDITGKACTPRSLQIAYEPEPDVTRSAGMPSSMVVGTSG